MDPNRPSVTPGSGFYILIFSTKKAAAPAAGFRVELLQLDDA